MADQEFLASFAVDVDESGVSRLQTVLEENRDLANEVAAAFSAATAAIREYEKAASGGDNPSGEGNRDNGAGTPSGHAGSAEQSRDTGSFNPEASARNLENGEYRSAGAAGIIQEWISGSLTSDPDSSVRDYSLRSAELALAYKLTGDEEYEVNQGRRINPDTLSGSSSDGGSYWDDHTDLDSRISRYIFDKTGSKSEFGSVLKDLYSAEENGEDVTPYLEQVKEQLPDILQGIRDLVDEVDAPEETAGEKTGAGSLDDSDTPLELDTAEAEESLEDFREKAEEPITVSLDASDSLGEGNDQSGTLNMDLTEAKASLEAFRTEASKPVSLSGNASGMVSAARSAYNQIRSLFSAPIVITATVEKEDAEDDGGGEGTVKMSKGGRFSRPTDVQVAEDGDAEYIIPVKKENRAVPLLKQLLSELSPEARASLEDNSEFIIQNSELPPAASRPLGAASGMKEKTSGAAPAEQAPESREALDMTAASRPLGSASGMKEQTSDAGAASLLSKLSDVLSASLHETAAPVVQHTNQNVSAPVSIQVHASSANAEKIGEGVYDTAERYLLRTMKSVFA